MAYQAPSVKRVEDNVIRVYHPEKMEPITYLTASVAAAGTTLTVKSNLGFSNTDPEDLLLFEGFGHEGAEIKRVNGAVTAGTSLTVQSLTFAHAIDTEISKVLFDKVEISGASTATGSKTSIATVNINISGEYTDYIVTSTTYNYYFVRFYNSLATTPYYSAYSNANAATGFDPKNVGFIVRNAFESKNEAISDRFPINWVLDMLYLGELDISKRLKRWSWLNSMNYDAGDAATGDFELALPTNIEDDETQKSILGLRIGTGRNLTYLDRTEYENKLEGIAFTTLAANISALDTTVTLTDSNDFEDSGSIVIVGESYAYTANNRSTNVLSGFTAFSDTYTAGDNVFQNVSFGEPKYYTVDNGTIRFDVPVHSDFNGMNYWLDYYKTPTRVNSVGDSVTVNDPYALQLWLEMQVEKKKNGGALSLDHPAVITYELRVAKLIENEIHGQTVRLVPVIPENRILRR